MSLIQPMFGATPSEQGVIDATRVLIADTNYYKAAISLITVAVAMARHSGCSREKWLKSCGHIWDIVDTVPMMTSKGGAA